MGMVDIIRQSVWGSSSMPMSGPAPRGVPGVSTKVLAGEGPYSVLRRLQGHTATSEELAVFCNWNGGFERAFHSGDVVYFPEKG